ncbi:MAG: hypothetical protein KC777_04855 [Cyanobacteria bacterium HKST-UBA02]|nr:hypothetical protein [Cyanobacteria bacterium HKST-UBA02]
MLRKRSVVVVLSLVSMFSSILLSPRALAQDANFSREAVPQSVNNLDLCTLAYQLYHQSLCLPLDPWYDLLSRVGSDRRDNICRFTHEYAAQLGGAPANPVSSSDQGYYSGPNSARGWSDSNLRLDPILTNYRHVDARLPAFTRDGSCFIALRAPAYVTDNIKLIEGMRYSMKPGGYPSNNLELVPIRQYPNGEDHLVLFEGGTGVYGSSSPAWSLMGFVMMQKTPTGYDAHIVFRGSRSGSSLTKTVWNAQDVIGAPKGNPDWITDLQSSKQIEQPLVSRVGKVTKGFAEAIPTMLGPVAACCKYLSQTYPAPEHIYVTGHSLGAGLASQFASAVAQGSFGDELKQEVVGWPWEQTTLVAFAQPIPGDPAWAASFDKISPSSQHFWVDGDTVVEASSGTLMGLLIDKGEHVGAQKKLSKLSGCEDNPHEVFVIRAALLKDLAGSSALPAQLARESTWGYYESFSKMLAGQPKSFVYPGAQPPYIVTRENLKRVLQNYNLGPEFDRWLDQVYSRMISDKSSYIGFKFQSTLDDRRKLVSDIASWMRKPTDDKNRELDSLASEFGLIDGNLGLTDEERWIYLGLILSRAQKADLSLDELMTRSEIRNALDSKVE